MGSTFSGEGYNYVSASKTPFTCCDPDNKSYNGPCRTLEWLCAASNNVPIKCFEVRNALTDACEPLEDILLIKEYDDQTKDHVFYLHYGAKKFVMDYTCDDSTVTFVTDFDNAECDLTLCTGWIFHYRHPADLHQKNIVTGHLTIRSRSNPIVYDVCVFTQ